MSFVIFMSGCDDIIILGGQGIPDETFKGIDPVFADGITVGNLTESYIKNTESLMIVNGRLAVLCQAHDKKNCGPK